jgi:hypothetical protein
MPGISSKSQRRQPSCLDTRRVAWRILMSVLHVSARPSSRAQFHQGCLSLGGYDCNSLVFLVSTSFPSLSTLVCGCVRSSKCHSTYSFTFPSQWLQIAIVGAAGSSPRGWAGFSGWPIKAQARRPLSPVTNIFTPLTLLSSLLQTCSRYMASGA